MSLPKSTSFQKATAETRAMEGRSENVARRMENFAEEVEVDVGFGVV